MSELGLCPRFINGFKEKYNMEPTCLSHYFKCGSLNENRRRMYKYEFNCEIPEFTDHCVCGQPIKNNLLAANEELNHIIIVGSCCWSHFSDNKCSKMCIRCNKIRVNIRSKDLICKECRPAYRKEEQIRQRAEKKLERKAREVEEKRGREERMLKERNDKIQANIDAGYCTSCAALIYDGRRSKCCLKCTVKYDGNRELSAGPHAGKTYDEVFENHKDYVKEVYRNKRDRDDYELFFYEWLVLKID